MMLCDAILRRTVLSFPFFRVCWHAHPSILRIMSSANSPCLTGDTPTNLTTSDNCSPGFFCPNNDGDHPPQYCPPTKQCQARRLLMIKNICPEPQGLYEPHICAPGYYCPLGGRQKLQCPKGHFCPTGSERPRLCSGIHICPAGSSKQMPITGLTIVVLIDVLILLFILFPWLPTRVKRHMKLPLHVKDAIICTPLSRKRSSQRNSEILETYDGLQKFVESSKRGIGTDAARIQIEFEKLGFTLKGKQGMVNEVLKDVTGSASPGSLLAVMGASGAGKSTFVKVLTGKARATSGITSINGTPTSMTTKLIGYVPQDDIVLPELTVRENILHSALIRLPKGWTRREIEEHVDTLIHCLDLSHVENSLVGDVINPVLSGGQRKRVSIGIELAAAPMMLILDEPTSGLDATSALSIIKLLKSLSDLGVNVICIIHQPRREIFLSLDRVLLLAGGRQIYLGNTKDSVSYFRDLGYSISDECNPADAIIDIVSGDTQRYASPLLPQHEPHSIHSLADIWKGHEGGERASTQNATIQNTRQKFQTDALAAAAAQRGAPQIRQIFYCLLRAWTQQSRQKVGFILEIVVGAISGLMIGLAVYQLDGLLFQGVYLSPFELLSSSTNYTLVSELGLLNSLAIGLAAAAPGVKTFGEEKTLYWRETASGHSRSAYFIGKILSTFFRIGLSSLHFTVFYALLATPIMPFGQLYLSHLLYFYCIYGLACAVSMVVSRKDGPLLAMIVSLIIGIFGGYGPSLSTVKSWHLEWIWRMCPGVSLSQHSVSTYLLGTRPGFLKRTFTPM
ncbi:hypothetical protein BU24DRAFT_264171 [Aaosphaeria arxii CBS 175.79]|uniref:ABC transporter domain-containing protein n=1 Tax=Aaosphaeria arxii CBS 175.79 TaxID=1450172 RepID=A0A6A5XJE9_9PLEO|nr:uncharacterized protein BU24DRAFT_264171 [Aaosphaeria arxii CBS 175.79]KAF2013083.1 hypothetical protein BU24DRAFT_264171 [Aaosphaeria arxii CBS 175.79]